MQYLKIENQGVCPPEAFTMLGVSLTRYETDQRFIGKFGSGCKHSILLLLRNEIKPTVFCGKLCMEFYTKPLTIGGTESNQLCVKYSGKDADDKTKSSVEEQSYTTEYGEQDWTSVGMAMREFVSNALDGSLRHTNGWGSVKLEVVEENKVRAKAGTTRVFIPYVDEVKTFEANLSKWFLHFGDESELEQVVLPKQNRNMSDSKTAVIYRRGVYVREIRSSESESLFDYNLIDVKLDESRTVDDYSMQHDIAAAFSAHASNVQRMRLFRSFSENKTYWEHSLPSWGLGRSAGSDEGKKQADKWNSSLQLAYGAKGVLCNKHQKDLLQKKGYVPVVVDENILEGLGKFKTTTTVDLVLDKNEMKGRTVIAPTSQAVFAMDFVWGLIEECNMHKNKTKPTLKCFHSLTDAESTLKGYVDSDIVYINVNHAPDTEGKVKLDMVSEDLLQTMLEELSHYISKSGDYSRDFQEYAFALSVKLMRKLRTK